MRNHRPILLLLALLCMQTVVAQQSYHFRHYSRQQGLSNLNVLCIAQDNEGLLWVGTNIGLNRFDGTDFHTYFADAEVKDADAMPSNTVQAITTADDGLLWIGTDRGLCSFDTRHEHFHRVLLPQLQNVSVFQIEAAHNGLLWLATNHGLICYDTRNQCLHKYADTAVQSLSALRVSSNGTLWIATYDGRLMRYDERKAAFIPHSILSPQQLNSTVDIHSIVELTDGSLALVTNTDGVYRFAPATGQLSMLFTYDFIGIENMFSHTAIVRPTKTRGEQLWLGTEDGIVVYDLDSGGVTHLHKDYSDPYALSDNAVHSLLLDTEGGIWAGTFFGGLNYMPSEDDDLFSVILPTDASGTTCARVVREMVYDESGRIWVGTEDGGVFRFDEAHTQLCHVPLKWQGQPISRNVQTLMRDEAYLWLGTFDEGIYVVDTRTDAIVRHYSVESGNELRTNAIVRLVRTEDGLIVVGTMYGGIYFFDRQRDTFNRYKDFTSAFVHDIYEDSQGTLWIATLDRGLLKGTRSGKYYKLTKLNITEANLTTIFEDSQRQLWLGTSANGIFMLDDSGQLSRPLAMLARSGLGIYKIMADADSRLWISTSDGLYLNADGNVSHYGVANGLPTNQFDFNSGFTDTAGRMYFGTLGGLVSFLPQSSKNVPDVRLNVIFTSFELNGHPIKAEDGVISLRHDNTSLSISFAVPVYSVPEAIWYRYRLEGVASQWTVTQGAQHISFAGLPPGSYTLLVQASRHSEQWSDDKQDMTRLRIVVRPPWWRTWVAYLLYLLTLATAVYFAYRYITRRRRAKLRAQNERKENERYLNMLAQKINFFTTITHEIRTPLSLIMGMVERMENEPTPSPALPVLRSNSQRLLNLVNQLLDLRKIESSSFLLNFETFNPEPLVHELCNNFTPAFRQKSIDFRYTPCPTVFITADREALTKIFSNLMSNAVKFCKHIVRVELSVSSASELCITVENDGPHIPPDQTQEIFKPFYQYYGTQTHATVQGSGLGLSLASSLAEMMNGSLTYEDGELNRFVLKMESRPVPADLSTPHQSNPLSVRRDRGEGAVDEAAGDGTVCLIVDDEQDLREFVAEELAPTYRILQATNGQEALEILSHKTVSLIVTDIMMPIMNGMELCKAVKTDTRYCHLPIVMLTAKTSQQDHLDALACKADAYIEKPFSSTNLKAQIDNLLQNRELIRSQMLSSPYTATSTVATNNIDSQWLEQLTRVITKRIDDPEFSVELIASEMNMSTSTLYRKVKGLTSITPVDFVRLTRLKKAAELLAGGRYRIKEVAAMTGFSSVSYFTACFMRQFGMTPGAFVKK